MPKTKVTPLEKCGYYKKFKADVKTGEVTVQSDNVKTLKDWEKIKK